MCFRRGGDAHIDPAVIAGGAEPRPYDAVLQRAGVVAPCEFAMTGFLTV